MLYYNPYLLAFATPLSIWLLKAITCAIRFVASTAHATSYRFLLSFLCARLAQVDAVDDGSPVPEEEEQMNTSVDSLTSSGSIRSVDLVKFDATTVWGAAAAVRAAAAGDADDGSHQWS